MFETVFRQDPMSPAAGLKYRKEILEYGGERDELVSLTEFLGRPPNNEAYTRLLLQGA